MNQTGKSSKDCFSSFLNDTVIMLHNVGEPGIWFASTFTKLPFYWYCTIFFWNGNYIYIKIKCILSQFKRSNIQICSAYEFAELSFKYW